MKRELRSMCGGKELQEVLFPSPHVFIRWPGTGSQTAIIASGRGRGFASFHSSLHDKRQDGLTSLVRVPSKDEPSGAEIAPTVLLPSIARKLRKEEDQQEEDRRPEGL
ncbi:unnamed protein product [Nezara viridula]|uniref:Uncharacterized protein n=1 Tax=Nezara viridula TaxID=85310 RepID=A0A9P0HS69_NEZVI|nr:unnamed protein product [Nezara viridula]